MTPHPDPSRTVADFYTSSADGYQKLWAPELLALSTELVHELPLEKARRVLDAGAGVGALLPVIAGRTSGAVFGADISFGMLTRADRRFPLAAMDLQHLAFDDESVDVGVIAFVLFHLPDPMAGLSEMHRVIVPGGWIGTTTWGEEPGYEAFEIWAAELDAHGARPVEPELMRHDGLDTEADMAAALDGHGFTSIETWTGWYDKTMTVDEFLEHRVGHGMSRRRFESLGPDARSACLDAVRSRLSRLRSPIRSLSQVIYAKGRKP